MTEASSEKSRGDVMQLMSVHERARASERRRAYDDMTGEALHREWIDGRDNHGQA
jgi:hypothetical protein